jgi:hypothetical protein
MAETKRTALMQLQEEKKRQEETTTFRFQPEINPISKKIMEHQEEDAIQRSQNWQTQKLDKITQLIEESKEKEHEDLKSSTQKLNYTNDNIFAVSKVKQYIDNYKNESFTHSFKRDYKGGQGTSRGYTPVQNKQNQESYLTKSVDKKNFLENNKPTVLSFVNLIKKDENAKANIISEKLNFEVH